MADDLECNEPHAIVGDFAFHVETAEIEVDDIWYVGSVMVLCDVATTILLEHQRTFDGGAIQ